MTMKLCLMIILQPLKISRAAVSNELCVYIHTLPHNTGTSGQCCITQKEQLDKCSESVNQIFFFFFLKAL